MKMNLREFAEDKGYAIKDESDVEELFRESLDSNGPIEVCGLTFDASKIVEELDPTAFRTFFNDWLDSEEWDEFEGDYMKRSDIEQCEEEYEEYENEEEE